MTNRITTITKGKYLYQEFPHKNYSGISYIWYTSMILEWSYNNSKITSLDNGFDGLLLSYEFIR